MVPTIETFERQANRPERVFRLPKACLPLGIVGFVLFSFMAVLALALPWLQTDRPVVYPILFITIAFGAFCAFAAGNLYLIVAARRSRVCTSAGIVTIQGVFRSVTVPLADVTSAVWSGWPVGGRLALYTHDRRLVLHLGNFANAWELASFFRSALPLDVQERYERYEAACVPGSEALARRQAREDHFFIALLPLMFIGLVVLVLWDHHGLRGWLAAPAFLTLVYGVRSLYSRWRARRGARPGDQEAGHTGSGGEPLNGFSQPVR